MSLSREFQLVQDLFNIFANYFDLAPDHPWRSIERQEDFMVTSLPGRLFCIFVTFNEMSMTVRVQRGTHSPTFTLPLIPQHNRKVGEELLYARELANAFRRFYVPETGTEVLWETLDCAHTKLGRDLAIAVFQGCLEGDLSKVAFDVDPQCLLVSTGALRIGIRLTPETTPA